MSKTWEASDSISSLGMEIDDSVEVLENPSDAKNANSEKEQRRYQRRRADEESLPVPSQTATAAGEVTEEGVGVERRVHRALALVIDMSRSMSEKDLLPSRIELVLKVAREFVTEYFEQSPISLLSIIVMRNSVASIKTPFTSDRFALDRDLQELAEKESSGERTCTGEMSFQNGLRIAYDALRQVKHMQAASEVLIIFGATMSCDPGTISVTIDTFAKNGIVCNTIALAAEVYVAKKIALKTGGLSLVALNERHFRDLFFRFTRPSPVFNSNPPHTVEIGFPEHRHERSPTFCACCKRPTTEGYYCPRCGAKSCHIPCGCPICGLFLLASYHLAKSYHHLFSLPQYNEVSALPPCSSSSSFTTTATASVKHHPKHTPARVSFGQPCYCYGCSMRITPPAWQCSACNKIFCGECEIYVHETLFNCPGCMEAKK